MQIKIREGVLSPTLNYQPSERLIEKILNYLAKFILNDFGIFGIELGIHPDQLLNNIYKILFYRKDFFLLFGNKRIGAGKI